MTTTTVGSILPQLRDRGFKGCTLAIVESDHDATPWSTEFEKVKALSDKGAKELADLDVDARGAELEGATYLTQLQVTSARGDSRTLLLRASNGPRLDRRRI